MKITRKHLVEVATLTSISIVIFGMLAPPWETGRQEAEVGMAYSAVRTLRDEYVGDAPIVPIELEQLDPWDTPYIIQAVGDGQIRVTSAGPNGAFDFAAENSDDIWSDMPTSPLEPFHTQRKWGLVRAVSIGFGVWIAFMAAYWWSERGKSKRSPRSAQAGVAFDQ